MEAHLRAHAHVQRPVLHEAEAPVPVLSYTPEPAAPATNGSLVMASTRTNKLASDTGETTPAAGRPPCAAPQASWHKTPPFSVPPQKGGGARAPAWRRPLCPAEFHPPSPVPPPAAGSTASMFWKLAWTRCTSVEGAPPPPRAGGRGPHLQVGRPPPAGMVRPQEEGR